MQTETKPIDQVDGHPVVSEQEWIAARTELLKKEKELTRHRDEINRRRLQLPWVKVDKEYVFDTPKEKRTLAELFEGRSQLLVYHFMYAPEWDEGCAGCSFLSDSIDGGRIHFEHHDVKFVAISRAGLDKLEAYKKRMGWTFDWVSSGNNDFNYDFGVSYRREDLDKGPVFHNFKDQRLNFEEQPGISAFYKDKGGNVYRTYSSYERGGDILCNAYNWLDMAPLGRNEEGDMGGWMHRHDQYPD